MKSVWFSILCLCVVLSDTASAGSDFLSAQSFPKTFSDLRFAQRMDILAEGYEPFETDFDEYGNCISNCPYQGFTIQDQIREINESETQSQNLYEDVGSQHQNVVSSGNAEQSPVQNQGNYDNQTASSVSTEPISTGTQPDVDAGIPQTNVSAPNPVPSDNRRQCLVFNPDNPINNTSPRGEPLLNCPVITSPYGLRYHPTERKQKMHSGVDLRASMGTNVFTVADGIVVKSETNPNSDACGKHIKIKHPNDMVSVYCHLNEIYVISGQTVKSGCMIAKSGNTGRSTGPHLHYSIRLPNGQSVNPERWMTCNHAHK